MNDDSKRTHEVRVGMSLYWAQTWPANDGHAWSVSGDNLSGWTSGTRGHAIIAARNALEAMERGL